MTRQKSCMPFVGHDRGLASARSGARSARALESARRRPSVATSRSMPVLDLGQHAVHRVAAGLARRGEGRAPHEPRERAALDRDAWPASPKRAITGNSSGSTRHELARSSPLWIVQLLSCVASMTSSRRTGRARSRAPRAPGSTATPGSSTRSSPPRSAFSSFESPSPHRRSGCGSARSTRGRCRGSRARRPSRRGRRSRARAWCSWRARRCSRRPDPRAASHDRRRPSCSLSRFEAAPRVRVVTARGLRTTWVRDEGGSGIPLLLVLLQWLSLLSVSVFIEAVPFADDTHPHRHNIRVPPATCAPFPPLWHPLSPSRGHPGTDPSLLHPSPEGGGRERRGWLGKGRDIHGCARSFRAEGGGCPRRSRRQRTAWKYRRFPRPQRCAEPSRSAPRREGGSGPLESDRKCVSIRGFGRHSERFR